MQMIWDAVTPYLVTALVTLIGLAVTWATAQFASTQAAIKTKTGLDIEAILREALHQALTTGAQTAVAGGLAGPAAIDMTINHATQSVPDAIAALGPTGEVLINLAKAKLAQILAGAAK